MPKYFDKMIHAQYLKKQRTSAVQQIGVSSNTQQNASNTLKSKQHNKMQATQHFNGFC